MPLDVAKLVRTLDLSPHPEGGWYRETFRSSDTVATPRGPRAASTVIFFALEAGGFSAWHRVESDEAWHHYQGGPAELHLLCDAGHQVVMLGQRFDRGEIPQAVVPAGVWQATRALEEGVLFGCTVAPGFDFADFQLADDALSSAFPAHEPAVRAMLPGARG